MKTDETLWVGDRNIDGRNRISLAGAVDRETAERYRIYLQTNGVITLVPLEIKERK